LIWVIKYRCSDKETGFGLHNGAGKFTYYDAGYMVANRIEPVLVPGASIYGQLTKLPPNASLENIRSLQREHEGATILSQNGYHVEQNPIITKGKKTDYKINSKVFDNIGTNTL
jgi:hypothetical protein